MWRIRLLLLAVLLACCLPAVASTCGNATNYNSADGGESNYDQTGSICVPSGAMQVTDCQLHIDSSTVATSGTIACGIYDSNGASGKPDTLLCYGTTTSWTKGAWNPITLSGCPTLSSGHTYHVAFNLSVGTIYVDSLATGASYYQSQTCCTMVNITSPTSQVKQFSIYLDLTPAAASATCTLALMGAGPC